jgi:hypothetical protein
VDVETGFHEGCHSLPGNEGDAHRSATGLEQRYCLHDCRKDRDRRQIARGWVARRDVGHWDADWISLEAEASDHDFHMVMAEDASQQSGYIAWRCLVVVGGN